MADKMIDKVVNDHDLTGENSPQKEGLSGYLEDTDRMLKNVVTGEPRAALAGWNNPKPSAVMRVVRVVVPWQGDSVVEIVRKLVLIVSVVVMAICVGLIIADSSRQGQQAQRDTELVELKEQIELSGVIPLSDDRIVEIKEEQPEILDKYLAFYDINPDLVGWIKLDNTPIDYPVVQSGDNSYYLYRDFEGRDSKLGAIFADWHVPFTPTSRPNNTVLYGHNISDGTYFAKLTNYYPSKYGSLGFYRENPTFTFDTIYEEGTYKIFAAVYINTQEKHGDVYEYFRKRVFADKAAFYDFAANIMDRSVFYTDVDLEYGDEIITLSTCYYPLGNDVDSRFVVFGRRVREGESAEVDVDAAYVNPSPLYFDYYYRAVGGSWAGRTWDTSLVIGLDEYLAENPHLEIARNED